MILEFFGKTTCQKVFNFGIQGDNATIVIDFVLTAQQENIDLRTCKAFVKSATTSYSFADKEPVEIEEMEDGKKIKLCWTILRKHSNHRCINVQLVFEGKNLDTVWQTDYVVFQFNKYIQADEEIANDNPTIIQDFERRITTLEEQVVETITEYDSYLLFPTVGKKGILYIDKEENCSYRYDEENLKYYCIGTDYKQIEIINGGILNNG